jgi:hypothetical protein
MLSPNSAGLNSAGLNSAGLNSEGLNSEGSVVQALIENQQTGRGTFWFTLNSSMSGGTPEQSHCSTT